MSTQRTPPKSNRNLEQAQSEPNINSAIELSDYVTNRNKRPRPQNSPPSEPDMLCTVPQEFRAMLINWQKEQTTLISKLAADINEIKNQNIKIQESNTAICKTNSEIERSMLFMNQTFEDLKKQVEELKKERLEQRRYIETLEKQIVDLQQRSRSSGIEIRNIPFSATETPAGLLKTVSNIGKIVGLPIPDSEIRDIYRLPGKPASASTSRPIIAEFSSVQTKIKMLSAVRSFNRVQKDKLQKLNTKQVDLPGNTQPIYVAEQLPASTKKLFYLARDFAKNNKYSFCWITNGYIYLRKAEGEKQILIKTEKCLQDLVNKKL